MSFAHLSTCVALCVCVCVQKAVNELLSRTKKVIPLMHAAAQPESLLSLPSPSIYFQINYDLAKIKMLTFWRGLVGNVKVQEISWILLQAYENNLVLNNSNRAQSAIIDSSFLINFKPEITSVNWKGCYLYIATKSNPVKILS